MFALLCTLLTATVSTGCGCQMKTATTSHHDAKNKKNLQEMTFVVPTPQCPNFQNSSGKHANIAIAAAYHEADVTSHKKTKKIHISDATIVTKEGKTTVHFWVSKKFDKKMVQEKIVEGFKKSCAEEKTHLAKPEKERANIKCWLCHKYDEYMKWVKTKWKNVSSKFEKEEEQKVMPKKTT